MSNGIVTMQIMGARIATSTEPKEGSKRMTYYPEYKNQKGEDVNTRLTIPILVNVKNQGQPSNMLITAWGKIADVCAKALSPGREINLVVEPKQYQTQYKQKGQVVLIGGQPLNITGYSYTLQKFSLGTESANFIASEIARGIRGVDWFKPGSADQAALEAHRKQINATVYTPGATSFGYAIVNASTPTIPPNTPTMPAGVTPEIMAAMMAFITGQQGTTPAPTPPTPPIQKPVAPVMPAGVTPESMAAAMALLTQPPTAQTVNDEIF